MIRISTAVSGVLLVCLICAGGVARAVTVPSFTGGPGVTPPGYPDFWGANANATLTENKNGTFTLSVIGSSAGCGARRSSGCSAALFNFPGGAYFVGNESLNITANFSASGMFTSGSYTITGSLPASTNPTLGTPPTGVSWGAQTAQTLLTANLTGETIDPTDEALGFTEVITGGWADQPQFTGTGTATESLWLYSLLSGVDKHGDDQGDDDSCRRHDGHCKGSAKGSAWDKFLAELQSGRGLKPNTFAAIGSIATVPLPAALWLFGSGLMGLAGLARRRRPPTGPAR